MWQIIVWLVVGGVAGWLASLIMKTDNQQGAIGNIAIGIVGALIGGFVMNFIGGKGFTGFNLWSLIVATLGSVIFIAILKMIRGKK